MLRSTALFAARLLLAVSLLGSTVQGFVVRTHVHAGPVTAAPGAPVEAGALTPADPACLLCEIAGHSPAIAPPDAPLTAALLDLAERQGSAGSAVSPRPAASHHWLGRGPPSI